MSDTDAAIAETLGLTVRQMEIARWISEGHSTKDIARLGDMSVATVRRHLEAIFRRTGCRSRAQLVALVLSVRYADRREPDAAG